MATEGVLCCSIHVAFAVVAVDAVDVDVVHVALAVDVVDVDVVHAALDVDVVAKLFVCRSKLASSWFLHGLVLLHVCWEILGSLLRCPDVVDDAL